LLPAFIGFLLYSGVPTFQPDFTKYTKLRRPSNGPGIARHTPHTSIIYARSGGMFRHIGRLPSPADYPIWWAWLMQITESIQCPFCGQTFELVIDTSVPSQRFTTDCEVCCRPFEVTVECEPGEILSLDVQGN
jgi:hypothetical protein